MMKLVLCSTGSFCYPQLDKITTNSAMYSVAKSWDIWYVQQMHFKLMIFQFLILVSMKSLIISHGTYALLGGYDGEIMNYFTIS